MLGLYLFENLPIIRDAVLSDETGGRAIGQNTDFLATWTAAALFHDIGYLTENEHATVGGDAWVWTMNEFNKTLNSPVALAGTIDGFHEHFESAITNRNAIPTHKINAHENLEVHRNESFWALLAPAGHRTSLTMPSKTNPLGTYYSYALRHTNTEQRPQFRDHGISGALMLLKLWHCFQDRLESLCSCEDVDLIEFQPRIGNLCAESNAARPMIIAAAQAIALHNVNRDIWDNKHAIENGLDFERYSIRLEADDCKCSPLAFLLGLADSLQEWDRPQFRSPRASDRQRYIDQDIHLRVEGGKILLAITSDAAFRNPRDAASSFSKCVEAMKRYLDPSIVESLLAPDATTLSTLVEEQSANAITLKGLDLYLSSFVTEYETLPDVRKDPLLKIYIPVRFELRQGFSDLPSDYANGEDLTDLVGRWLADDGCLMFLLGDYGSGKTSFLRHLMYDQALAYQDNRATRIPILIRLREHTDSFKYPHFLSQHLQTQCGFEVPFRVIEQLMEEGKLLILLDGFDELATKATVETRQSNFQEIGKLFRRSNKIILSSRPTYFLTDDEIRDIFEPLESVFNQFDDDSASGDRKRGLAKRRANINPLLKTLRTIEPDTHTLSNFGQPLSVTLAPFSNDEIIAYLKAAAEQSEDWTWEQLLIRIEDTFDLQDLARRPILLKMIVATLPQLPRDKPISASELYEAYTIQWLERDYSAERPRHLVDKNRSYQFMTSLAKQMFDKNAERISAKQLGRSITDEFGIHSDVEAEALVTDIRTCSFLLRDEAGFLEFAHKSFREYFLSLYLLPNVMANNWAALREPLPWEVLLFLGHHLQFENEANFLRRQFNNVTSHTLNKSDSVFVQNCLTLYSSMMLPINTQTFTSLQATAFRLWRTESLDMRFENSNLTQCKFEKNESVGLAFANSRLDGCVLTEGEFKTVRWSDSSFNGGEITDTEIVGDYVSAVRFVQTDLSQSTFRDVLFDRVRFVNVNFRKTQFESCYFVACEFVGCTGIPNVDECRFKLSRRDESTGQIDGASVLDAAAFAAGVRTSVNSTIELLTSIDERIERWRGEISSRIRLAEAKAREVTANLNAEEGRKEKYQKDLDNIAKRSEELDREKCERKEKIAPDVERRSKLKARREEITDAIDGYRKKKGEIKDQIKQADRDAEPKLKQLGKKEKERAGIQDTIDQRQKEAVELQSRLKMLTERAIVAAQQIQESEKARTVLAETLKRTRSQVSELERTDDGVKSAGGKKKNQRANKVRELERKIDRDTSRLTELEDKMKELRKECSISEESQVIETRLDEIGKKIGKDKEDLAAVERDLDRSNSSLEPYYQKKSELEAALNEVEKKTPPGDKRWRLKDSAEKIQQELETIATKIGKDETRIQEITGEVAELVNQKKSVEGRIPEVESKVSQLAVECKEQNDRLDQLKRNSELSIDHLRFQGVRRDAMLDLDAIEPIQHESVRENAEAVLLALLGPRKVCGNILKNENLVDLIREKWEEILRGVDTEKFVRSLCGEIKT